MTKENDISKIVNSFIKIIDEASKEQEIKKDLRGGKDEN